ALHSGGGLSCRRGRPGKNCGIKEARRIAAAKFTFEQIRARDGTNDSHWNRSDDRGGAGSDEKVIFETRYRSVADGDRGTHLLLTPALRPAHRITLSESRFNGFSHSAS